MLIWSQIDFIECLGTAPKLEVRHEIDEDGVGHHFSVHRDGLRLLVSIYEDFGEVWISLHREQAEESLFTITIHNCPGARYVKNKTGWNYLEFAAANIFGGPYDGQSLIPMGVRLSVDPDFKIELFEA